MENKYEKFNIKKEKANTFVFINDEVETLTSKEMRSYLDGVKPELSIEQENKILELIKRVDSIFTGSDMFIGVEDEIKLNIANIGSKEQVIRYLNYLKNEYKELIAHLRIMFFHHEFSASKIDVSERDYDNKGSWPVHNDLISRLICTFNNIHYTYIRDLKFIEGQLNPDEILILDNELEANIHRLVVYHKVGSFDPFYQKFHSRLGITKFSKLLATLMGVPLNQHSGFKKTVSDFITETYHRPHTKKTAATPTTERKVNAYLVELGLMDII